jgi:hypothetical protein
MMNYTTYHSSLALLLFAALFATSVNSCASDQPTSSDSRPPAIYGRLLDAAGNPVANAGVNPIFGWDADDADTTWQKVPLYPNPAIDETTVHFIAQQSGKATIQLLRADTRALIRTILDSHIEAGEHMYSVDVRDLPNMAYIVRYKTPSDSGENLLIVGRWERSNEGQIIRTPLVRTDSDGRFMIPYSSLPLGSRFYFRLEAGQTLAWFVINNSLRLVIDSPDSTLRRNWNLTVDTTAVADSTLRLP